MPQDAPRGADIIVEYTNEAGGQIAVTIDGDDFATSASRTKPRPIIEQAEGYIGTIASSAWHHPTDVTIPTLLAPVLGGVFNPIAPQAQQNAQAVVRIAVQALTTVWRDPKHLRLALQLFLVYKQTDLRGQMLLAASTRLATGFTFFELAVFPRRAPKKEVALPVRSPKVRHYLLCLPSGQSIASA